MAEMKPNHICKNPNCKIHYYACDLCDRSQNYKSVACSRECFEIYTNLVLESRMKNKKVDILPDRTDMSKEEVKKLMKKPVKEVEKKTKKDLSDYIKDEEKINLTEIVEKINKDINEKSTKNNNKNGVL